MLLTITCIFLGNLFSIFVLSLLSCSVMSNSLWPYGLQHTRILSPSLSPRVCSDSCPLSWWYHPTISSFAAPFFFCLQSLTASGSFPVSHLIASGGQSIGASASASVLPEYSALISFRIEWFDLSPRDSQESSPAAQLKSINSLALSLLYGPTLISIHDNWKNHSYD